MKTFHLFLFLLLLAMAGSSQAQWSGDPKVGTPICTDNGRQTVKCVISTDDGAFIVWKDDLLGYRMRFIYKSGQIIPIAGSIPLTTAVYFHACHDLSGNLICVYDNCYAQKYDRFGNKLWGANDVYIGNFSTVPSAPVYNNHTCGITPDGVGGAIFLCEKYGKLYAHRITANGIIAWGSNGVLLAQSDINPPVEYSLDPFPMIDTDGAGGAVVFWVQRLFPPPTYELSHRELYAQRISASGNLVFTTPKLISDNVMISGWNAIRGDEAGGAFISWVHEGDNEESDIYAQRLLSNGSVAWQNGGVPVSNAEGQQLTPVIELSTTNEAIFMWRDIQTGVHAKLLCQKLSEYGQPLWGSNGVLITDPSLSIQGLNFCLQDGQGGALVTFQQVYPGTVRDVYMSRITVSGVKAWGTYGTPICNNEAPQGYSYFASDGAGGAIIAWNDSRNTQVTSTDIYTAGVHADGSLYSNAPPLANAGPDQSIECGNSVTLDGTGSSDPDNDALTYTWKEGSTTLGTGVQLTVNMPLGTHTIDLTVEDPSNETDTDQVVITVTDNTAPVITCKPATVMLSGGTATITTNDVDDGTTDACSAFTLSVAPSTFTCSDIGVNTVTLTATDDYNNTSTCTATVTVVGAVPIPSITVDPSPTVANHDNNTVYLGFGPQVVTLIASGDATDSYSWSPATYLSDGNIKNPVFAVDAEGTYSYTVTVTNQYGCTGTATVSLEVLDWRCSNNPNHVKIMICHAGKTICVGLTAVQAHLDHGDNIGNCQASKSDIHIPAMFTLSQNYPNPFNPSTTIEYGIPEEGDVCLRVFDLLGREVAMLVDETKPIGIYTVDFDGTNHSSGTYVYRLEWNGQVMTRRMTLMK